MALVVKDTGGFAVVLKKKTKRQFVTGALHRCARRFTRRPSVRRAPVGFEFWVIRASARSNAARRALTSRPSASRLDRRRVLRS